MKSKIIVVVAILVTIGYVGTGVHYIVSRDHKIQVQAVQLKSATSDLKEMQLKYDMLNTNLDKELQRKTQDADRVKQLETEKKDLERQKTDLEAQVQAKADKKNAETLAAKAATALVGTAHASGGDAKSFIYAKESGNNPGAINASSGACGLGQALPCSKMPCSLSDYACQDTFFTGYMSNRYGSWENAKAFWLQHSWW